MASVPFLLIFALFTLNPVTISVYPQFAMTPATFRVTVLVPRHVENRLMCYSVDGPELRRSCISLDGEHSQRVWTSYWELRTSGDYVANAELTRVHLGKTERHTDRQPFRVIGGEMP